MSEFAKEITPIAIEHELKQSYLDYAMSVIVGRALPDVRDGLKPVHRRVLYAMQELKNDWNKPYKKSARIVGDVMGKYHPHGDTAIYDTIVRMAQPFSMRYLLVDGQGNFGSVDGDAAAAMRYTEVRLSKFAHALMLDLEKDTVDFAPNYDDSQFAPVVLPTRVPHLLVNGSSGIAVGMATNIPPHNLSNVIDACLHVMDKPEATVADLMQHIPGPDFPTGGLINGRAGIVQAYETGRGKIYVRAKAHIEGEASEKQSIIVTELPYQINKARLLEKIGELVKEKRLEGIVGLRDESDKQGMRMVIELRRGEEAEVLLNQLYNITQLQTVFGINMVALDEGQPKVMPLKAILNAFLSHRRTVVTRRTIYELAKARARAHILEGLGIALVNIDAMIALIKAASNPSEAKDKLLAQTWAAGMVAALLTEEASMSRPQDLADYYGLHVEGYRLSPEQAQAILDLRLHRLTGLEQEKIIDEYKRLIERIRELMHILANPDRLQAVVAEELREIKEQFGDERRTEILNQALDLSDEDLIPNEEVVVTVSQQGYVKTQALDSYVAQKRGGRGKSAATVKDTDFVRHLLVASRHDTVLCFSSLGRVYWLKVYQLPLVSRISKGKPIVNLLPLQPEEQISAILPLREYTDGHYLFMATAHGVVKKVPLNLFSRPRSSGVIAVDLRDDDRLVGVDITTGECDVMLFSDAGKVIRFPEVAVRPMGRIARGVRGIRLAPGQRVISLVVARSDQEILTATERGYGKRTALADYRITGRGGQGVISIQVSERNGKVIGAQQVATDHEMLLITDQGTLVRTRVEEVSLVGRNTQGVRLIRLSDGETLIAIQKVEDVGLDVDGDTDDEATADNDTAEDDAS